MNADYTIRLILVIFAILLITLIVLFQFYKCYIVCDLKPKTIVPDDQSNNIENV